MSLSDVHAGTLLKQTGLCENAQNETRAPRDISMNLQNEFIQCIRIYTSAAANQIMCGFFFVRLRSPSSSTHVVARARYPACTFWSTLLLDTKLLLASLPKFENIMPLDFARRNSRD